MDVDLEGENSLPPLDLADIGITAIDVREIWRGRELSRRVEDAGMVKLRQL